MFSISSVSSLFRELFSGSSGYEEEPEIFSSKWRLHFIITFIASIVKSDKV